MIFSAPDLPLPLRMKTDLCVVGTGAGGATAAMVAAESGMSVLLLEAGEMLTTANMTQREEQMLPRLYWESGGRATADRVVRVHQGRGVGGSTLHNLNLCKRIPDAILKRWGAGRALEQLPLVAWQRLYGEVEDLIGVQSLDHHSHHNQLLAKGCRALGWRSGGLKHNRAGCKGSGFCELGCAYDAKNNALKVMIPRAVAAGAQVLASCQVVSLRLARGRVVGVDAVALDPSSGRALGPVQIDAAQVCLSASASGTAALLSRSKAPDGSNTAGRRLRMHPAVVVAGDFVEPVHAYRGIPQSIECTEWLELDREDGHRVWIVPAFAHPVGTATMMPGHGAPHRALMQRYDHLAVLTAMIHDHTAGRVEHTDSLGLRIDYQPNASDQAQLRRGLWACAKLLLAAGAQRVHVPARSPRSFAAGESVDELLELDVLGEGVPLNAVHPMGSVPMHDDPSFGAVASSGRHHHLGGLWIADGSLFPSSIGVPPQLSIYAMGLHVGRQMVAHG